MGIEQRKTYSLVDKSRQGRFLAQVAMYNLAIVLFFGITLLVPDFLSLHDESLPIEAKSVVADRVLYLHTKIWPTVAALICLIALHSFRFFHRFIGPLFRFRWAFDQIREGYVGFRIRLRGNDLLHREADSFNLMLETVAPRLEQARSECQKALETISEILADEEEIPARSREKLDRARMHLSAVWENVGWFHMQKEEGSGEEEKVTKEAEKEDPLIPFDGPFPPTGKVSEPDKLIL